MVIGERRTLTAGKKSLLGDESRDDGLEEKEWGDMGLASGEKPPCCSTGGNEKVTTEIMQCTHQCFPGRLRFSCLT